MQISQDEIKQLPCGIIGGTYVDTLVNSPMLIADILETFPDKHEDFIWDVKVHMLMPGLYPCLPAWHCDFVPRPDGKEDFSLIDDTKYMYLWFSGEPLPIFKDGRTVNAREWIKFTQRDSHKGLPSEIFTWRIFIRAAHKEIAHVINPGISCVRRHTQVYIDVNTFNW